MTTLLINIKELVQVRETSISKVSGADMKTLPKLENAFLYIVDDVITDFGLNSQNKLFFSFFITAVITQKCTVIIASIEIIWEVFKRL